MLHEFLKAWFHFVETWGYLGVFVLMAMESSIIPVPSEVVIPPAAFWAAQGRMSLSGVILAATAGSYFGSAVSYLISRWIGAPLVMRYGKYFFLPPKKVQMAEDWVNQFGHPGIFLARLLPVIRHLISIPAGILKMNYARFSVSTILGAGLWCAVLAWFGREAIGDRTDLLDSPEAMISVVKDRLHFFVIGVVAICVLYALVLSFGKKSRPRGSHRNTKSNERASQ
ncbi:MAG: DedA family protein [Candidatus Melainabacteria bacterium]|nr:DedA family protein [Candidatus Melainabacteria bacterium]